MLTLIFCTQDILCVLYSLDIFDSLKPKTLLTILYCVQDKIVKAEHYSKLDSLKIPTYSCTTMLQPEIKGLNSKLSTLERTLTRQTAVYQELHQVPPVV